MKILIPTYLDREQVAQQIADIEANSPGCEVFASCTKASASVNRNLCLDQIKVGDTAIMVDDDISGFYNRWTDHLLVGLTLPNAVMVSARLLNADGSFGPTCSECFDATPMEIELRVRRECVLPTAAIAFKNLGAGIRYDERFLGSGFEDNDIIAQICSADPNASFLQSNRAMLYHRNEMKEQKGPNWNHNRNLFWSKWPNGIPRKVGI